MLTAQITLSGSHYDALHTRYDVLERAMNDYSVASFNAAKDAAKKQRDAAIKELTDNAKAEKDAKEKEKDHYKDKADEQDQEIDGKVQDLAEKDSDLRALTIIAFQSRFPLIPCPDVDYIETATFLKMLNRLFAEIRPRSYFLLADVPEAKRSNHMKRSSVPDDYFDPLEDLEKMPEEDRQELQRLRDTSHGNICYECRATRNLCDMEALLDFMAGTRIGGSTSDRLKISENAGETRNIMLRYLKAAFFKKGTTHIEFLDPDLLEQLNIFACQQKDWLPPDYGKTAYEALDDESRSVVDSFQGEAAYREVCRRNNPFEDRLEALSLFTLPD